MNTTKVRLITLVLVLSGSLGCDRSVGQEVGLESGDNRATRSSEPPPRSDKTQRDPGATEGAGTALAGSGARSASGFAPGRTVQEFWPLGGYVLELDGEVIEGAQMYNEPTPAILLMAQGLPAPVVLWLEERKVESINLLKVSKNANGAIDILPNPSLEVHDRPLLVDGGEVRFEVYGRQAVVKLKPPLVGLKRFADLTAYSEDYLQRAEFYQPSPEVLEELRKGEQQVRVRVYFGTWCPACGQMVPRVVKVAQLLDQAGGSKIDFEFYGLPRQIRSDPEASRDNIQQVPTGVIYVDNREVGRISGVEWRTPESVLAALLSG